MPLLPLTTQKPKVKQITFSFDVRNSRIFPSMLHNLLHVLLSSVLLYGFCHALNTGDKLWAIGFSASFLGNAIYYITSHVAKPTHPVD